MLQTLKPYLEHLSHDQLEHGVICNLDLFEQLNKPAEELMAVKKALAVHVLSKLGAVVPMPSCTVEVDGDRGRCSGEKPGLGSRHGAAASAALVVFEYLLQLFT